MLDPVRARHRNERRAGIAIGGVGTALLIGIARGIGAWRDNDLAESQCPNGVCTANGARLLSRAHTLGLAADMLIGTGAIALAGGVILYRGGRDTGARSSRRTRSPPPSPAASDGGTSGRDQRSSVPSRPVSIVERRAVCSRTSAAVISRF